jgi:hypothetical protein
VELLPVDERLDGRDVGLRAELDPGGSDPQHHSVVDVQVVAQHYPVFTAPDRLLVSTHDRDGTGQYIREYFVDEKDNTLRALRSIPTDRYAVYGGQAQQLPSGNFLWELGSAGSIQELLPDGTVVWEAGWKRHLVGHVTPIADLYALTTGW